jgi:hypothetical protein
VTAFSIVLLAMIAAFLGMRLYSVDATCSATPGTLLLLALNDRFRTGTDQGNPTVYLQQILAKASAGVDAL